MLNIGDKVFIAKYGAGIVKEIKNVPYVKNEEKYVNILLFFDNMNILIPINKINNYSIRNILDEESLDELLEIIKDEPERIEKNWNKRYRKNRQKIDSGDFLKICEVLRDLYYLKKNSLLPQGEEKILERVEGIVVSEIMLSFGISLEEAYIKIRGFNE